MMLELSFMEKYRPIFCAKNTWWQFDAAMWTRFSKQNKTSKVCCKNMDVIDSSFAS